TAAPPWSMISCAARLAASPLMSLHTTAAPRAASASAYDRPSPRPAPVTIATSPSNRIGSVAVMAFPASALRPLAAEGALGGVLRARAFVLPLHDVARSSREGERLQLLRATRSVAVELGDDVAFPQAGRIRGSARRGGHDEEPGGGAGAMRRGRRDRCDDEPERCVGHRTVGDELVAQGSCEVGRDRE